MAATIIATCFPEIDVASLRPLGSGWEFDAFSTADGWAFRFPRRAECADLFEAEARVHRLVGEALPPHVALPRVELIGPPTLGFPYRFAGHRLIPGIPAHSIAEHLLPTVAHQIATVLGALHSIPESRARAAGVSEMDPDDEGRREWLEHGVATARQLRGLDPVVDQALPWLTRERLDIRPWNGPLQFIHHDMSSEHLIVDPATGALTGILDWTDAILGDAARDFVFLATWEGWDLVEQVLVSYPRPVDEGFRTRLRFMARLLSLMWLVYAHEQGCDLSNHIQMVRNVFEPGGAT
jgi:aminoglycoside phosphotransferase (APT) family kinase protein